MKKATTFLTLLISAFALAQTVPDSLSTNPQTQQNAAQRILSGNINTGLPLEVMVRSLTINQKVRMVNWTYNVWLYYLVTSSQTRFNL